MKKIYLLLPILVLLASAAHAQTQPCNCNITPFEPRPPCFDTCTCRALARATMQQLVAIVGLNPETAQKIAAWPGRLGARSLQEYSAILNPAELSEVGSKLDSMSAESLQQINGTSDLRARGIGGGRGGGGGRMAQGAGASSSGRSSTPLPNSDLTYYYAEDSKHEWHWKVKAGDGRTIAASSDGYKTETECLADIDRVKNSSSAQVKKE